MSYTKRFIDLHKQGKIDDTTIIKMAEFKEEMSKYSGIFSNLKNLIVGKKANPYVQGALLMTGLGIGQAVSGDLIDYGLNKYKKYQTSREADNVFQSVYEATPELHKYDIETARKYFSTLFHFSPRTALDPLAAKSWMLSTINWETHQDQGMALPLIQTIADIEKKTQPNQGYPMGERYLGGPKSGFADRFIKDLPGKENTKITGSIFNND